MRPSMRKARLTSVSAATVPVIETLSPPLRGATVTTRTGLISGAGGGALSSQAPSSSSMPRQAARRGMVRHAACSEAVRGRMVFSIAAAAEYPKRPSQRNDFLQPRKPPALAARGGDRPFDAIHQVWVEGV